MSWIVPLVASAINAGQRRAAANVADRDVQPGRNRPLCGNHNAVHPALDFHVWGRSEFSVLLNLRNLPRRCICLSCSRPSLLGSSVDQLSVFVK
jgi:hypothetical protein